MNLIPFEEKVVEHALCSSGAGKHAARSALRHLERAWELFESMPELAIFLGITAEEESATAVFHSLKKRQYNGAELLKTHDHRHKTALHPLLLAIGKTMREFMEHNEPKFEFDSELLPSGKEYLRIRLTVFGPTGDSIWAYPYPPLHFSIMLNDVQHDFQPELSQLASEKEVKTIYEYIKKLANRRNQALYATEKGIPHADKNTEKFLMYRKSVVFSHLIAYLLIEPYAEQQLFVQQALNAFLSLLKILPQDQYQGFAS